MKILSSALPFAGLGFDLAPVRSRARLMMWRQVPRLSHRIDPVPVDHAQGAHGYGLLVFLCREIRGS